MVNLMGMPIGMTLMTKGMTVSGTLVSEAEYLESLSKTFSDMMKQAVQPESKEEKEAIEDAFDFGQLAEGFYPPSIVGADDDESFDPDDFDPEALPPPIRHLHLKDVKILTPNPPINFGGGVLPIMRIRLTSIDGWMLGHAEAQDDDLLPIPPDANNSDEVLH
jgi:hypothetical protein